MADAPGAADRGMPVTSHCLAAFAGRAMMSFAQNGDARVLATESRECLSRQRSRINSCIRGLPSRPQVYQPRGRLAVAPGAAAPG